MNDYSVYAVNKTNKRISIRSPLHQLTTNDIVDVTFPLIVSPLHKKYEEIRSKILNKIIQENKLSRKDDRHCQSMKVSNLLDNLTTFTGTPNRVKIGRNELIIPETGNTPKKVNHSSKKVITLPLDENTMFLKAFDDSSIMNLNGNISPTIDENSYSTVKLVHVTPIISFSSSVQSVASLKIQTHEEKVISTPTSQSSLLKSPSSTKFGWNSTKKLISQSSKALESPVIGNVTTRLQLSVHKDVSPRYIQSKRSHIIGVVGREKEIEIQVESSFQSPPIKRMKIDNTPKKVILHSGIPRLSPRLNQKSN